MDDLYQQVIMDHYQHPRNHGRLKDADYVIAESNASCGDNLTFYLKTTHQEGSELVDQISFEGTGCAVSTAAASLLTEYALGKPLSKLQHLDAHFMEELLGISVSPARLKCLTLAAKAFSHLFQSIPSPSSEN